MGEGVPERILQVRKEPCRIEELGSLQMVQQGAKLVLWQPANCMQEGGWHIVPDYGGLLQQMLSSCGQCVDTRGEHRLSLGRKLGAGGRPRKAVAAPHPVQYGSTGPPSHHL